MNRDCMGDAFKTEDGKFFYRCLLDGTMTEISEDKFHNFKEEVGQTCNHCNRLIFAHVHIEPAPVRTREITEVFIVHGQGHWFTLKDEIKP